MDVSRASLMVAVTVTSVAAAPSDMEAGSTPRVMLSGLPMVTTASLTAAPGAVPDRMTDSLPSSSLSVLTVKVRVNVVLVSPGAIRGAVLNVQIV